MGVGKPGRCLLELIPLIPIGWVMGLRQQGKDQSLALAFSQGQVFEYKPRLGL